MTIEGIDPAITLLVQRINERGIRTFQSCSGHADAEGHPSALLWLEPDALSIKGAEQLSEYVGIERVALLFGREVVPVWEVEFSGETLPEFQQAQDAILSLLQQPTSERCVRCGRVRETAPDIVPQVCEVDTPEIFCVFPATGADESQRATNQAAIEAAREIEANIAYLEDKAAQESIVDDLTATISEYIPDAGEVERLRSELWRFKMDQLEASESIRDIQQTPCPDCEDPVGLHALDSRIVGCQAGDGSEERPTCGCRTLYGEAVERVARANAIREAVEITESYSDSIRNPSAHIIRALQSLLDKPDTAQKGGEDGLQS
jgi:hypothetical protein